MILAENRRKTKRISSIGTVIICILAIIFSVINITVLIQMQNKASSIYTHPYTVSNAAREIQANTTDIRVYAESLSTYHTPERLKEVNISLQNRFATIEARIENIKQNYLGPEKDVANLVFQIEQLKNCLQQIQQDAMNNTPETTSQIINQSFHPIYNAVNQNLSTILTFSDTQVKALESGSFATARIAILGSVLLSLLIILLSIYFRYIDNKQNHEILYREMLFNLLSSNIDDVFIIYNNIENQIEYISANVYRILGIDGKTLRANIYGLYPYLSEEDIEKFRNLSTLVHSNSPAECEFQFKKPGSNELRWMKLRIYPVHTEKKASRYITTITDLTETINIQQALKDALLNAQNANAAKRSFLSRMSHEIRTPMNAIIGMTTIAAASIQDRNRVADCLKKISFSSKHLLSLINDILDMSKIEDGKLTINNEPFELQRLIEAVTSIIYPQSIEHGQNFKASLVNVTEDIFVGDLLRLNQILLNLLSNAIKFTPEGGTIQFKIQQLSSKKRKTQLRFIVSDTGIGMSREYLNRLYTPFEQENAGISQNYGGTGLGMSIAKNLVTLMGGTIEVESQLNHGTTFTVDLPFDLPEYTKSAPNLMNLEQLHVLIADDDENSCEHTAHILDGMGIQAKWVLTGKEAVSEIIRSQNAHKSYDVCFVDWKMPDMDGIETTRQIRQHVGADTLIIIMTAYDWNQIEKQARKAGVNSFLSKPVFASSLYNALISVTEVKVPVIPGFTPAKQYNFSGKRILVAEDNELNMEIAVELLKFTSATIECAVNGKEAADLFLASEAGYFNIILMDIQMPVLDGYAATALIRSSSHPRAKTIPILAMTANAFNEDIAAALSAGMNGHIAKPIHVELLYQTLAQYMK